MKSYCAEKLAKVSILRERDYAVHARGPNLLTFFQPTSDHTFFEKNGVGFDVGDYIHTSLHPADSWRSSLARVSGALDHR